MKRFAPLALALGLLLAPLTGSAQPIPPQASQPARAGMAQGNVPATAAPKETAAPAPAVPGTGPAQGEVTPNGSLPGYTPMAPNPAVGLPQQGQMDFQTQFTPEGQYAHWIHNAILLPIIVGITLLVLVLIGWSIIRYRQRAHPVASKTSHNTALEIAWTVVPVLILLGIAVPSIDLIAKQYRPAPKDAVTIKATGYQWYWGYTYPDYGGFEVISNLLPEQGAQAPGARFRTDRDGPRLLAVDNRMVVPAGVPLRIQTTGADVIHSFAVPSLWFKLDAVPGRLNERHMFIEKPGVYFGQCSELCGARHAFMPIVVEALPMPQFLAWVRAKGGTMPGAQAADASINPAAPPAEGVAPGATTDPSAAAQTQAVSASNAPASRRETPAATPPTAPVPAR